MSDLSILYANAIYPLNEYLRLYLFNLSINNIKPFISIKPCNYDTKIWNANKVVSAYCSPFIEQNTDLFKTVHHFHIQTQGVTIFFNIYNNILLIYIMHAILPKPNTYTPASNVYCCHWVRSWVASHNETEDNPLSYYYKQDELTKLSFPLFRYIQTDMKYMSVVE